MNSLTAVSDRSSHGLSFSGASTCCALFSSALAAFAMTSLQAAPGLGIGPRQAYTTLATFPTCVYRQCRMHGDTQEIGDDADNRFLVPDRDHTKACASPKLRSRAAKRPYTWSW